MNVTVPAYAALCVAAALIIAASAWAHFAWHHGYDAGLEDRKVASYVQRIADNRAASPSASPRAAAPALPRPRPAPRNGALLGTRPRLTAVMTGGQSLMTARGGTRVPVRPQPSPHPGPATVTMPATDTGAMRALTDIRISEMRAREDAWRAERGLS